MIKRLLHSCFVALFILLGLASVARTQIDSIYFIEGDSIDLGTVQLGTSAIDTVGVDIMGEARWIFAQADSTVTIISPQFPRVFIARDTLRLELRVTPRRTGPDTLRLIVYDTLVNRSIDTLLIYVNGFVPASYRLSTDSIDIGPLLVGGAIIDSFYIVSLGDTVRINSVSSPDGLKDSLTLLTPLPTFIQANDSAAVRFSLKATQVGFRIFHFNVTAGQTTVNVPVTYEGVSPSDPDSSFALDPTRNDVFAAIIESAIDTFVIKLRNTTGTDLFLDTVEFDPSPYFKLSYLPSIVSPGEIFSITLELETPSLGFFRTNIRLPNDGGLASEYTLGAQVLRIAKNSVPVARTPSGIRVIQSAASIAIDGIPFEVGELTIYDLLGREVVRRPVTSREMMIAKLDATGARIEDGCYVMRITDARGRFSESIKLLLLSY